MTSTLFSCAVIPCRVIAFTSAIGVAAQAWTYTHISETLHQHHHSQNTPTLTNYSSTIPYFDNYVHYQYPWNSYCLPATYERNSASTASQSQNTSTQMHIMQYLSQASFFWGGDFSTETYNLRQNGSQIVPNYSLLSNQKGAILCVKTGIRESANRWKARLWLLFVQRASFLLLPWLVLIAALTPLFVVAIVFGAYAVRK